jgi:hypothetical protein
MNYVGLIASNPRLVPNGRSRSTLGGTAGERDRGWYRAVLPAVGTTRRRSVSYGRCCADDSGTKFCDSRRLFICDRSANDTRRGDCRAARISVLWVRNSVCARRCDQRCRSTIFAASAPANAWQRRVSTGSCDDFECSRYRSRSAILLAVPRSTERTDNPRNKEGILEDGETNGLLCKRHRSRITLQRTRLIRSRIIEQQT